MGKGGGGGGAQPTAVTQTTIPEYAKPYMENLLGRAQALSETPYQTYGGERIASATPEQLAAREAIAGLTTPAQFGEASSLANTAAQRALSVDYSPAQISARMVSAPSLQTFQMTPVEKIIAQHYNAPSMTAAQSTYKPTLEKYEMADPEKYRDVDLQQYMSPYIQGVVDITKREALRDAEKAQLAENLATARKGTYGASGQILAMTERERALGQQLSDIQARGLQAAYEQAATMFDRDRLAQMEADKANLQAALDVQRLGTEAELQVALGNLSAETQARVANLSAELQTQGLNADQAMRAAIANQQTELTTNQQNLLAKLSVQQLGAEQATKVGIANQLADLDAQRISEQSRQYGAGLSMQGAQAATQAAAALGQIGLGQQQAELDTLRAKEAAGALAQAEQQAVLDQQYQDFIRQQQYPYAQIGFMSDLLRGSANLAQTGSRAVYETPPSAGAQALGLASSLGGAYLLGGRKAQGGEVKSYAEGGEVKGLDGIKGYAGGGDVIGDMVDVAKLTPEQIQQTQQTNARPDVPDFVLLAELDKKLTQIEAAKAQQGVPETTVAEDIRNKAAQEVDVNAGLPAAPIPDDYFMPEEQVAKMAGGGIIALANGGGVRYNDGSTGYPIGGLIAPAMTFGRAVLADPLIKGTLGIGRSLFNVGKTAVTKAPVTTAGAAGYGIYDYMSDKPKEEKKAATEEPKVVPKKEEPKVDVSPKTIKKVEKAEDAYEKALKAELDKTEMSEDDKLEALGFALMKFGSKAMQGRKGREYEAYGAGIDAAAEDYAKTLQTAKKDRRDLTKTLAEYGLAKERNRIAEQSSEAQLAQAEAAMVRAEKTGQAGVYKEVMDSYGKYLQANPKNALPFPAWAQAYGIPGYGGSQSTGAVPTTSLSDPKYRQR